MCLSAFIVTSGTALKMSPLSLGQLPHHFSRNPHSQNTTRDTFVFWYQRTGPENRLRANLCVVKHNRVHSHQHSIA